MTGASLCEPHTCVKNKKFNCIISVYRWDVHIPYMHFSLSNISMYCYIGSHSYIAMLKSEYIVKGLQMLLPLVLKVKTGSS